MKHANQHAGHPGEIVDFNRAPFLVIWEVTRACTLACKHCRAAAEDVRHPDELTTEEGFRLLEDVAGMGTPIIVFTGGDPLQRNDLECLVRHGKSLGLRVGVIPAATELCTRDRIRSLSDAGVDQLAISLDSADSAAHDDLRGVPGAHAKALEAAGWVKECGVPLQINSVIGPWNERALDRLAEEVRRLGAVFWEVFFLVPTGRGVDLERMDSRRADEILAWLLDHAEGAPYLVKIAEAPQHRRIAMERMGGLTGMPVAPGAAHRNGGGIRRIGLSPTPVNAGRGFAFVDHTGGVCPSGFLPMEAGRVRERRLSDIYRNSELFRALRDPGRLRGRCGRCAYRSVCGGSRSRAHAVTGDPLAEDPLCPYDPSPASASN
ncbi:MAG: TIGR04053 family radical SAM/SPASM domain-containing protein [Kiritimatiellae bacterium]|nr:TIGR04053 family radical SAM/SPASM domain-containing protein [Kiritimatiellia bacterium]